MSDLTPDISVDELIARGLYDPDAPDADHRRLLIQRVLRRGGTIDDIAAYPTDLETLASRLQLRTKRARYTFAEVIERAGLDPDRAFRFNRACGFPDPDPGARIFDDDDVEIFAIIETGNTVFGEDRVLQITRVMGWAMSRIAEAMISIFASNLGEQSQTQHLDESDFASANAAAVGMIPAAVRTMDVILRRHMEARSRGDDEVALGADWEGIDALDRAVGFCDLVGYTELSEQLTTTALAKVLESFEGRAADIVVSRGGSVVKLIGDEVMFVAPDAGAGQAIALDLVDAFRGDELPPVRVGIAFGRVILREADYFGSVVNVAARIVKLAPPGVVLAPASIRDHVTNDVVHHETGSHQLKGFDEPVELVEVRRP